MLPLKTKLQFEKLCYSIYPLKIKAVFVKDLMELDPFLRKNRLIHYFYLTYKSKPEPVKEYFIYREKISKSLKILKKNLGEKDFMVIKTFSVYPHITGDLDIVVKDKKFVKEGKLLKLPVAFDISDRISWTNDQEVSSDFIWKNTSYLNFSGIRILVPNSKLDLIIRLAHLPFEQSEIRLGELLHIFALSRKLNLSGIEKEAKKNNWQRTYLRTKKFLDDLHQKIYQTDGYLEFPYKLPYWQLAAAVLEKRAWFKILGARYVIRDRLFNNW